MKLGSTSNRRSRRGLALGSAVGLGALLAGAGAIWFGIHHTTWMGPALADGARAVVGPRAVAWLEDTLYGAQDRWNRWRHGDSAPVSYWAAPSATATLPPPVESGSAPASDAPPAAPGFSLASFSPPHDRVAAPGDGVWIPASESTDARGVMLKTMVHPDPKRPFAAVAIVAMDLQAVRLRAVAGTAEPRTKNPIAKEHRPGVVDPADVENLLAAFNGGFLTIHGHYGMMVDGVRFGDPRPTSCTVALYKDGAVRVRSWPELEPSEAQMQSFRQTPQCLVEQGKMNPALHSDNTHWGAAVGGGTVIRRSVIGVSADGRTLFFGMGDALTAKSAADAMVVAGAYDVAQLDVNHSFPRFMFYDKKAGGSQDLIASGLIPGFTFKQGDYVKNPSFRDFFYVTRKATPTS
ncbi:MAG TPA: phosphodiester glycosidase family protein [Polyangiaceae bacterium]|mgnify:CR=1 FL=1|nr:phosphodiester glycosidase family protein [Polyangiaceae bacterium]